jgi:hypothetical protein
MTALVTPAVRNEMNETPSTISMPPMTFPMAPAGTTSP